MNLADLASRPEAYPKGTHDVSYLVQRAHKMVLPDDTLALVQHMRTQPPKVIAELLRNARPPYPVLFVEANLNAYRETLGFTAHDDEPQAKTGLLILDRPKDSLFQLYVVDSVGNLSRFGQVFNWPLMFEAAYGPEGHPEVPTDMPQRIAAVLWGYDESHDLRPMRNRGIARPKADVPVEAGALAVRETQGIMRYAIALLALLNGPATLHEGKRAATPRTLIHGKSHLLATPSIIRVEVPKRVRDPNGYVLKQTQEGIKKRLHEVRGHWRVVARCPATAYGSDGSWERIETDKGPRWRKWIANHERGDAALGDLRGRTLVPVTGRAN